ncbi:hypothetical protein GCG54_00015346 [Colletotrichum gloeosporioides]|uniref:Uncharacterized protein n=1 Tax=Colletotrichum gloeosporioides TaxID=474922 RepID=A0A8H4FEA2_COLGL|nr:uncharacterized protein GCG54_00015346 [Colletotrichum gloeosporioides]KAF3799158.1 hypothetical protein GCG54_00015346 [Colletotrichum gloeosporioides]
MCPDLKMVAAKIELAIKESHSFGQLVHDAARGRPQAYTKWIILKYAEILFVSRYDWFQQGTLESLSLAIRCYAEAAHVLCFEPVKGLKLERTTPKCIESVIIDERVKDSVEGSATPTELDARKEALRSSIMAPFFCGPLNSKFKKLRSLVHDTVSRCDC